MDVRKKAGIVCCSNGQLREYEAQNHLLAQVLLSLGYQVQFSSCIYANNVKLCGSAKERANALMDFYKDDSIQVIFDISGGDVANEILDYLDFGLIAKSQKQLWGYSDLTTVLNAIYTKTGNSSVLYQIKNLVYDHAAQQQRRFAQGRCGPLFDFSYRFVQGTQMEGVIVGGNTRCFLKLAGTAYFPDVSGKLLLLEALGGEVPQVITYFSQLKQMGVFDKISGVILGTFTKMEQLNCRPSVRELLLSYVGSHLPVIQTNEIGHGTDSKAIVIGSYRKFE